MKTVLNLQKVPVKDRLMFLGPDLGLQRYDELKYPIFLDLWKKQRRYDWEPERIDLSKDRTDYQKLNPTQLSVFNKNIRFQTLTDSLLSRSILKMREYVSNPELEICMTKWAEMETVHSFSYTHIFKNVTSNATEFFDSIIEDVQIQKRLENIRNSYDKFFGETKDIKQMIFDSVLNTQAIERITFYCSFICSFYFGSQGIMEGNTKIIGEIARDENLHQAITLNILKNWKENEEEGFQKLVKENEDKIYEFYKLVVNNEKEWAEYLFSDGVLMGLNPTVLGNYSEYIANHGLYSMGYKKIFNTKTNPVSGWSDRYFNSGAVQEAPQETEKESYLLDAVSNDTNQTNWDDFKL